jgi:glutamyl-tRNA synthetase
MRRTRLAPSPTGALHLGNARTFLINWALARQQGWKIGLRIEDLDTPRVKPGAAAQAVEDLQWLGLDWDDGPTTQLADLSPYRAALDALKHKGVIYPCRCTRSEIAQAVAASASAPHGDEHELRYPGTCRPAMASEYANEYSSDDAAAPGHPPFPSNDSDEPTAWRLLVPDAPVAFRDEFLGAQSFNVQAQVGDFAVATKAGLPAYQLAVVVDDHRQGVTDIVRGDDLLPSAARQMLLYRELGFTPLPRYYHVPLVLGPDGRRLAKRHGDTRLAFYRQRGVSVRRLVGLLAHLCGLTDSPVEMTAVDFAAGFRLLHLSRSAVTFTPDHHAWLCRTA